MNKEELLFQYCLRMADNNLILSHRLAELCSKGPILEEDIALTNISLDLLGQASSFYKYCAELENKGRTEDDLAYHRNERHFYNFQLSEYPNMDFAYVIVRQFFTDSYNYFLYEMLSKSKDEKLAAICAKSLKEVTYHLRHSRHWVISLGGGTNESHNKIQDAVNALWMYTGELFEADNVDTSLLAIEISCDLKKVQEKWFSEITKTLDSSNIVIPDSKYFTKGSKEGIHTEHLGHILSDMQFLQRAYPEAKW